MTRLGVATRVALAPFALSILGLGISAYLTVEHYTATESLVCPENRVLNCAKVTSSSWSMLGPAPVALLGLLFFVGMAAVCSPWLWDVRGFALLRIAGSAAGVLFALYLVWGEFRLHAICLWCTGAHLTALALLVAVLWTATASD
jgi:uncharacterized membrane protein